jgi:hypothetical protein
MVEQGGLHIDRATAQCWTRPAVECGYPRTTIGRDVNEAGNQHSLKDAPENAVWTYEKPYDEMSVLRELLAFYPDKVDSIKTT